MTLSVRVNIFLLLSIISFFPYISISKPSVTIMLSFAIIVFSSKVSIFSASNWISLAKTKAEKKLNKKLRYLNKIYFSLIFIKLVDTIIIKINCGPQIESMYGTFCVSIIALKK